MMFIGIDPGKEGAIAFISDYHSKVVKLPVLNRCYDYRAFISIILNSTFDTDPKDICVIIEKIVLL